MLVLLLLLFCQINLDQLVNDLGKQDYKEREVASNELKQLGFKALPVLKANLDHNDTEIALRCGEILSEYFYITDKEGNIPSIWFLNKEHRFPKGFEILYSSKNDMCSIITELDIGEKYVLKLRKNSYCEWCDESHFYGYLCWKNKRIEQAAMRLYITDQLNSGVDREELQKIVQQTSDNMKTHELMFQTKDIHLNLWDFWDLPPGVIVLKEEFVFPSR